MTIRQMTLADVDAVVGLQAAAFPPPFPQDYHWDAFSIRSHLKHFPEGQFVAETDSRVVGSCSNTIIPEERWQAHRSWIETVGDYALRDFDDRGNTLYGMDITVHPDVRRQGVGRAFYERRYAFCRERDLKRYGTGCRMPDFRASGVPTVEQYAEEVVAGKRNDRTLTPLLRYGLTFIAVVRGYMEDYESDNAGALLERTF
jgi:ribosomal protein S18 acetylase RimI-like enzyme